MALKKCKECQGGVSSKAKTCPHCGYKNTNPVKEFGDALIGLGVLIIFGPIVIALGYLAWGILAN